MFFAAATSVLTDLLFILAACLVQSASTSSSYNLENRRRRRRRTHLIQVILTVGGSRKKEKYKHTHAVFLCVVVGVVLWYSIAYKLRFPLDMFYAIAPSSNDSAPAKVEEEDDGLITYRGPGYVVIDFN